MSDTAATISRRRDVRVHASRANTHTVTGKKKKEKKEREKAYSP